MQHRYLSDKGCSLTASIITKAQMLHLCNCFHWLTGMLFLKHSQLRYNAWPRALQHCQCSVTLVCLLCNITCSLEHVMLHKRHTTGTQQQQSRHTQGSTLPTASLEPITTGDRSSFSSKVILVITTWSLVTTQLQGDRMSGLGCYLVLFTSI